MPSAETRRRSARRARLYSAGTWEALGNREESLKSPRATWRRVLSPECDFHDDIETNAARGASGPIFSDRFITRLKNLAPRILF